MNSLQRSIKLISFNEYGERYLTYKKVSRLSKSARVGIAAFFIVVLGTLMWRWSNYIPLAAIGMLVVSELVSRLERDKTPLEKIVDLWGGIMGSAQFWSLENSKVFFNRGYIALLKSRKLDDGGSRIVVELWGNPDTFQKENIRELAKGLAAEGGRSLSYVGSNHETYIPFIFRISENGPSCNLEMEGMQNIETALACFEDLWLCSWPLLEADRVEKDLQSLSTKKIIESIKEQLDANRN